MSFYTPGFLHKKVAAGGGVTSLSYITSGYTDDSNTAVVPATAQAGDLLVFTDAMFGTAGTPADVTPAGWTKISTQTISSNARISMYYKICSSTDPGSTISDSLNGGTGPAAVKRIAVFRGNVAITTVTRSASVGSQITTGTPTNQTISASGQAVPMVCLGFYEANLNVTTRGFSPAADAELAPETPFVDWLLYKIYNSSPVNHTISMADYGTRNCLMSLFLSVA